MKNFKQGLVFGILFLFAASAQAQTFGGSGGATVAPTAISTTPQPSIEKSVGQPALDNVEGAATGGVGDIFFIPKPKVPQLDRPTLDGVKRGTVSINPTLSEDSGAAADDELIFLYYKDFKVDRLLSGRTTCNVGFIATTTLSRKLSNLSVKLVWPNMTTAVSFDDVMPNTETQFVYTLMGDGCFSMDKVPNIVVNRCRVKDLTQSQCAAKIRWLNKQ